ncbi:hypothetical protein KUCAC02_033271 [Chaenocephalus aceratus]|nr:hypothetical protein KUCAC02_033271 [Chaenocephalus aceratus]
MLGPFRILNIEGKRRGSLLNYKKCWILLHCPPPPQAQGASSEVETLIRDIWAGRRKETLWAKYGPYTIYSQSVGLGPGRGVGGRGQRTVYETCK